PLRQVLMNFLRSSPLRPLLLASALQVFIFSRCAACLLVAAALSPLRQLDMKLLRSSPLRPLLLASALQSFMRCCCRVAVVAPPSAGNGGGARAAPSNTTSQIFLMRETSVMDGGY